MTIALKKYRHYELPPEERERLTRKGLAALKMMLAQLSSGAWVRDDLADRLECIPSGKVRLRLALGGLRSVCDDIIGTVPDSQVNQILGTMRDFDIRMVPRMTPSNTNVIMTSDDAKALMDMAMERCHGCVEDGQSCRKCRLYKLLESTTPLDDYGSGLSCPYSNTDWG